VQAAGFTWAESARRAWAGLEAIHALRPAAKPAPAPQRRSLAITAPLPPQPTGIANYTSQLLTALADEYDITLVSADPAGVDAALVGRFSILDPATFLNRAGQFDRVLHQVGNSRFHAFQFDCLMPRVPGVMVLHDVFLSNALHALAHGRGEPDGFRDALLRTQGVAGVCLAAREGELAAVRALPSSLEQIRQSLGLILHSRHARDLVRDFYGEGVCAGVHIVPTTRELGVMPDRAAARARLGLAATALVVASFGGVTAFKMPEVIIAGFAAALRDRPGAVLALVGEAEPSVAESLAAQANAAGIGDALRLTGRIVDATYLDWLAATDIAVQLRRDSRGETSAAAADCLAAGVASIVNGHGALGELPPDTVIMLPDRVETAELAREIGALAQATERRRALGAAGRAHAVLRWSAGTVAAQYRDAIEACYAAHPPAVLAAEVLRGVRALAHGADAATVRAIGKALAESFPFPRPRRIMFDISAWSDPEHGGDASDDWSVLATALLTATGLSDRGEWLSWQGGRAVVAWGDAATWLDIAPLADVPSERTMPGDLLLCPLGPNPTDENALALAEWARRGGARVVGLAWSGRHPPAPAVADATLVLDALADTKPHSADGLARAVLAASTKY